MPTGNPRSGQDRQVIQAASQLRAGQSEVETGNYLQDKYPGLSIDEVDRILTRAQDAIAQGDVLSFTLAEQVAAGEHSDVELPANMQSLRVDVTISMPGMPDNIRSIIVHQQDVYTEGELLDAIEDIIDQWSSRSGLPGQTTSFNIAYVL